MTQNQQVSRSGGIRQCMFYVYILKSLKDDKLYTGYSSDLDKRLKRHNDGLVLSTKSRRPFKLIYYQAFLSRKDAMREEKYLKSGGKAQQILKTRIQDSLNF